MMRGRGADEGPAMLRLPYRLLFVAGMAVLMATGWYALDHEGRICDIHCYLKMNASKYGCIDCCTTMYFFYIQLYIYDRN